MEGKRKVFAVNRSLLLEDVLKQRGWASIRDAGETADFVMWDRKSKPFTEEPPSAGLRLVTRADMQKADNKRHMWVHCKEHARAVLPPTFLTLEEAEASAREDASGVWFLKKAHTAGGRDIVVGDFSEVARTWRAAERPRDWLLQRGVRRMLLCDGRKVTLRCYVLWMPSGAVSLWMDGLAILHGEPLPADDAEQTREAHVDHHGCERRRLSTEPYADELWGPLREAVRKVFGCFRGEVNAEGDSSRYMLFGADFVISQPAGGGLAPVLIEINQFPNMSIRSDPIGKAVKRDLFEDLYTYLIAPACEGAPPKPGRFEVVVDPPPAAHG
eukprot:TRINITY_DN26273_c0_g1_i2.p1 TRINITY_DN26273_c0_g1~~TRINITY_DN26273_c0_g1_i2.p1  ORF type:complete len:350 (+),score=117.28 TRINITY_DN26273_c0_g1_i2:69-1052(+)